MTQSDTLNSGLKKYASLNELFNVMQNMNNDPLANAGTQVVICRGNPQAKIVLVGEAPGPQENIQGKPFVGKAGQLLDKIFETGGIDSNNDLFITNSVFRMPPGDDGSNFRKPNKKEIEYYRPYVYEIIRLINPHIILLTGNVACQSFLGKTGITSLRGKWIQQQNHWVMPIFHPSYLLRNQSKAPGSPKSLMSDDIHEVCKKYNELLS